ncbi:MAG: hypothetical protein M3367_02720 [Acidobacteriota bacterium]|nr:hypothetical protein [Acidobacteriota bacterium]
MKITISLLLILILSFSAFGQTRKTSIKPKPTPTAETKIENTKIEPKEIKPTQKVIVEKANGDRLTGLFVGGDGNSITVDISGAKVQLSLSEISAIKFGEIPTVETKTVQAKTFLNFEGALIYKVGGVQPLARQEFYLLDNSAESVLANSGVSKLDGGNLSFLDNYAFALRGNGLTPQYTNLATRGTEEIKKTY